MIRNAFQIECVRFNPRPIYEADKEILNDVTVVIPACFEIGTWREKAFWVTIEHLLWSGFDRKQIQVVSPTGDTFCKGELITRGISEDKRKYLLQVDADLLVNWGSFFRWLNKRNYKDEPCLPFNGFLRMNREESSSIEIGAIDITLPLEQGKALRAKCAGGFWIPADLYLANPIDKIYTGWGCEDVEFGRRIEKIRSWKVHDLWAAHHWHEYDRQMNLSNLEHSEYHRMQRKDWNRIRQKLAILCPRRSGSNLLERSLDLHPDIEMFHGEPFGVTAGSKDSKTARCPEAWVLNKVKTNANTFGFRLMDHDPKYISRNDVLEALKVRRWKFIRLYREDTFAQLASFWLAKKEKNWINLPYETKCCTMDPEWAKTHIELMKSYEQNTMKFLAGIPRDRWLRLRYEDMVDDFDRTIGAIQDFLGTKQVRLEQGMNKQMSRDPRRVIKNHLEIEKLI